MRSEANELLAEYKKLQGSCAFGVGLTMKVRTDPNGKKVEAVKFSNFQEQLNMPVSLRVAVGTTIEFELQSTVDCYAYLFDVDPTGVVTQLLPNEFWVNNHLKPNEKMTIPLPGEDNFDFVVENPCGHDTLTLIAFEKELDTVEKLKATSMSGPATRVAFRAIATRANKPAVRFGISRLQYEIVATNSSYV